MTMDNDEIDNAVRTVANAYMKGVKLKEGDREVAKALVELTANVLKNLNDIAYVLISMDQRQGG